MPVRLFYRYKKLEIFIKPKLYLSFGVELESGKERLSTMSFQKTEIRNDQNQHLISILTKLIP